MVNKKRGGIWIVLGFFLLVFSLNALAVDGCYYHPGSALYCTKISEDQARNDFSSYQDYFSPGKECSAINTCTQIICNVNCQYLTQGECADLSVRNGQGVDVGWESVTEENYNDLCSSGCCRVGSNCYYPKNKWECSKYAKSRGLGIELWDTSILSDAECGQICGEEIKVSSLSGHILNETLSPIPHAKIEIAGKTTNSGIDGKYQLELNPGTYSLKITAPNFSPLTQSISLRSNENKKLNLTLFGTNKIARLSGYVKDSTGAPIKEATIAWEGAGNRGLFSTDALGFYDLTNLVLGSYNLVVSKPNYKTNRTAITLTETTNSKNFILETAILQGIKGNVYLHISQEKVYGASLYIDDVFRGFSKYDPLGEYELSLETGPHTIYANYYGYELPEKINFTINAGEPLVKDLVLVQYVGECSYSGENPQKKVETFSAQPVLGEKKVLLEWQKPCPELSGYNIYKYQNDVLLKKWEASPAELSFLDSNVEWGQTYQYKIEAFYTDGVTRASEGINTSITLGDQECESKYHQETGWDSFCLVGAERNFIWTCDDNNKKVPSDDCSVANEPELDHLYFCAETGTGHALCKDAGSCGWLAQAADPFGLYYEKQKCYGVSSEKITKGDTQNYCYFDYTKTLVDKCSSCSKLNRCSDYKSADACEINNCLGKSCYWIEGARQGIVDYNLVFPNLVLPKLVTPETGQGYCAEKDSKEDQCSLCGPQAGLFQNYFCTAEICSGLGRCFSADKLKKCESCGESSTPDHNCYTYSTELECINEKNPLFNSFGEITLSQDRCGWGRCAWQGIHNGPGNCVKDGDGNGLEDCESLAFGQSNCKADNGAPSTKLIPEGIQIISLKYPTLTFRGEDKESNMGVLEYCLDSALPNVASCTGFEDNHFAYPGRQKAEELKVNLITSSLKGKTIPGETFRLRYYSKDQYSNQEEVQEAFVFVDNEPPQFEINEEIKTQLDTTQLKIYLTSLNLKPAKCDFQLKPLLPKGTTLVKNSSREEKEKQVTFEDLKGVIYELAVSCEDDYGNINNKNKTYVFDLEGGINILRPKGAVRMTNIIFEVETLVGSSCSLYKTESNEKIADFISDSAGKNHKTNPVPGFFQGNYPGTYKVVCQDLLRQKPPLEDYFNFAVDFFGSASKITMEEGNRKVEYTNNWKEEHFVESVKITLSCLKKEEGFDCDKIYYCLTNKTREPKESSCYQEFTGVLNLSQSQTICYYSKDQGGNEASDPICGRIWIDGYGIRLVAPKLHWFGWEQWGISNQPVFDLKLITLLPTIECKFNFGDPGFNYNALPPYKKLTKEGRNYIIRDFPNSAFQTYTAGEVKVIYVKCKDGNGKIGPVQKINLEYDPTLPVIITAYAQPNPVYEEDKTLLHVETDDKTLCKFDEKSKEYGTMGYSFPGIEEFYLNKAHETSFVIGGVGPDGKKDYALVTQCMNGAGNFSEMKNLTFSVDYSSVGFILSDSLQPRGFIASKNVLLSLLTSKNAQCTYKFNDSYLPFDGAGGRAHQKPLSNLAEKEHIYPVQCLMIESGKTASEQIKFTVDLTPPVIEGINNSRFSCSLKQTPNFRIKTNETALSNYSYELYDNNNNDNRNNNSNRNGSSKLLINKGTIGLNMPFKISADLQGNHTYSFRISAVDQAGNVGAFKESGEFLAIPGTDDRCRQDTQDPDVEFLISDSSCTKVTAEMLCDDHDDQNGPGCGDFYYGQSLTSDSCEATEDYSGQKIVFEKSGWLCYKVQDNNGNTNEDQKKIEFHDEDGDGISNSCDQCLETEAGSIVDEIGCAPGETPGEASDDSLLPPTASSTSPAPFLPPSDESRLLAWAFLILGLFLVLGGAGYLIYYYKISPKSPSRESFFSTKKTQEAGVGVQAPSVSFRERLLQARKSREEKEKTRKRELLFGNFNQSSKEIPHVEKIIRKEGPHLEKLEELTGKYMAKKEEIKPGLKPEEKDIFDRLEKISQQTKEKKIEEVVSKKEAKTIFEKLKAISEKRKKE